MKKVSIISIILLFLTTGCCKLPPCGDFEFTGSSYDTSISNGVDMNISFDFDPEICCTDCTCDLVCYVQMVRVCDLEDGIYLYATSEKADRATDDGWYIDRLAGRIWGYYGRYDDGSFAPTLQPGSNTTNAILYDAPRRGESDEWMPIWWQAVSVPVCIDDGSGCENNLLGYYFWSWVVDENGVVLDPIHGIAWKPLEEHFNEAVDEWNLQAPGLGKNNFPAFSPL
jgi:hypothetical protein